MSTRPPRALQKHPSKDTNTRPHPPKNKGKGRRHDQDGGSSLEGAGVNQLKSALRQTKRLLARDNVEPGMRQEAERRLISIEEDIETKQSQQVERQNAQRYHKIRFFERQKIVRRIKKLKKAQAEVEGKEIKGLKKELGEARVLLNYVLHFPMSQKYVALFPAGTQQDQETSLSSLFTMAVSKGEEADKSRQRALQVRKKVEEDMRDGRLSDEPEMELERRAEKEAKDRAQAMKRGIDIEGSQQPKKKTKGKTGKEQNLEARTGDDHLEGDDFFATRDD